LPENLVTLGSHTLTHPFLPSIGDDEARREIAGSRTALEGILNRKIGLFSFPFGGFNQRSIELCREAGYDRVFTTLPNFALVQPNEFVVGRVRVDPTDSPLEFRLKLAGAYRWLPFAFRLKHLIVSSWFVRATFNLFDRKPENIEPRSYIQA
jgi:peptidoglycan/xylan/chitin deacetylase (PgdA/CDA1 family)